MKQLLTLMLLVLSTLAFANTAKNTEPKPTEDQETTAACKKAALKTVKTQETTITKPAAAPQKAYHSNGTTKACTTAEKSAYGITGYFVDFVHRSNVKLVNMLID